MDAQNPATIAARIETWVFDLDNTLYPASCRLFDQVDRLIGRFIAEEFALDLVEARRLQKQYFHEYGTTLSGLMQRHGVDPARFLDYVHAIDLTPVAPAPRLDAALARLGGRKLIFTNGSVAHAANVMDRLGVAHHFEDVFDIRAAAWIPKPLPATYDALVARHAIDAPRAAMIDDLPRNLAPAAALGMTTVLVETGEEWSKPVGDRSHIHHTTDDLVAWLETAAPSLTV